MIYLTSSCCNILVCEIDTLIIFAGFDHLHAHLHPNRGLYPDSGLSQHLVSADICQDFFYSYSIGTDKNIKKTKMWTVLLTTIRMKSIKPLSGWRPLSVPLYITFLT